MNTDLHCNFRESILEFMETHHSKGLEITKVETLLNNWVHEKDPNTFNKQSFTVRKDEALGLTQVAPCNLLVLALLLADPEWVDFSVNTQRWSTKVAKYEMLESGLPSYTVHPVPAHVNLIIED